VNVLYGILQYVHPGFLKAQTDGHTKLVEITVSYFVRQSSFIIRCDKNIKYHLIWRSLMVKRSLTFPQPTLKSLVFEVS
jgi:hypothetical protein